MWNKLAPALLLLLPLAACQEANNGPLPPTDARQFMFGMRGLPDAEGQFVAITSDASVLAKLESELARPAAQRTLHITGPIARGGGGYNLSWSWSFVPDQWDMVELSVETCDGTPQMVEDNLDHWLKDIGVFCPWASYVQREL